jgi:hypothetical protein
MKVALLITGQLRTWEFCKYSIKNSIINHYDTDVFLSIDTNNILQETRSNKTTQTSSDEINNAINFYKPLDYFILPESSSWYNSNKNLINIDNFNNLNHPVTFIELVLQQYYIVNEAYKLLIKHVNNTGVEYTHIIRVRFDNIYGNNGMQNMFCIPIFNNYNNLIVYNNTDHNNKYINNIDNITQNIKVEFENPENNSIYVFGTGQSLSISKQYHIPWCNDQFWLHSPDIIFIMADYFNNLPNLLNDSFNIHDFSTGPTFETYLCKYLLKKNIILHRTNVFSTFVRAL